jgi:hypothetical protein
VVSASAGLLCVNSSLPLSLRVAQAGNCLDFCFDAGRAAEITLQPIRRFGFDAAILFSDILVVPLKRELADRENWSASSHAVLLFAAVMKVSIFLDSLSCIPFSVQRKDIHNSCHF